MKILSRSELRDRLFGVIGATKVSFIARTVPKLIGGKSNRLNGMVKVAYVAGIINFVYKNAVNNQRGREAEPGELIEDFVPLPRPWGKRLHDVMKTSRGNNRVLPLVAHKKAVKGQKFEMPDIVSFEQLQEIPVENLYLEFEPEKSIEYRYFHNDVEVPNEEANAEIYRSPNEGQRQEVEDIVRVRDYMLGNIQQITFGGETYQLA